MKRTVLLLSLVGAILSTSTVFATDRHVPSPYPTIQAAIDAAVNGDRVIIAQGTYTGAGNRELDFGGKAISVQSTDPNNWDVVAATIIDCQYGGRGFHFHSGETASSVLAGLTITNGYADFGGGIFCTLSSPTIRNCKLTDNIADYGGGIENLSCSPTVANCMFVGNGVYNYGGGMYNAGCTLAVSNCIFTGNFADRGGGMENLSCSGAIVNCTFTGNSANMGGGMDNISSSGLTVSNCILWGDTASTGPEIYGSISVSYSDVQGGSTGTGNINADPCFVSDLGTALPGVTLTTVPEYTPIDVWVQDEAEIGYSRWPVDEDMPVVWDLPRNEPLDAWPEAELLGPDFGWFAKGTKWGEGTSGGNIEVSPPMTGYDFGRVVVGSNFHSTLENFIDAQNLQRPVVKCDTDWLAVGHIDEVISFVPAGSGFKVLIADTDSAIALLEPLNEEDDGAASSGGPNTLTDTSKGWDANKWKDGFIEIVWPDEEEQVRQISGNTSDKITVYRDWDPEPGSGSVYSVVESSAYKVAFIEGDADYGVASGFTSNTLTDSTKSWTTDEWAEHHVKIVEGPGAGKGKLISSNTSNSITIVGTWSPSISQMSRYILVKDAKLDVYGEVAAMTVRELMETKVYQVYRQIDILYVKDELDLYLASPFSGYVKIPTLFKDKGGAAVALMPNMVNSLVCGTTVVAPEPFGPRNPTDIFKDDVSTKLTGIGLTPKFVDDWDTYHAKVGNIHCGTNARREPPDEDWWE